LILITIPEKKVGDKTIQKQILSPGRQLGRVIKREKGRFYHPEGRAEKKSVWFV
jgi:hypothetical protein